MGSTFKCFFCLDYHSEYNILSAHTKTHSVGTAKEILEKYVPKGKRTLQVDISDLSCRICDQKYPRLEPMREHLEKVHGKEFGPAGNGMIEYNMEVENNLLSCHVCGKGCHTFNLLNSHMNSHIVKVVCENCGAGFPNQHMLNKHKEMHFTKRFGCKLCDKTFLKKSQLKYHIEIVHKGKERAKPKKCPHCPETFKEYYGKMVHLRDAHGITKTFQCHVCKSSFATRRSLTEHSNRYHSEKYKCDVCSKCFAIESRLKQHMRGHTGERNFVCTVCKNAYMHKVTLRKHMKCHGTEFRFICSNCGVGFHGKNEYSRHVKQWHNCEGTEGVK